MLGRRRLDCPKTVDLTFQQLQTLLEINVDTELDDGRHVAQSEAAQHRANDDGFAVDVLVDTSKVSRNTAAGMQRDWKKNHEGYSRSSSRVIG